MKARLAALLLAAGALACSGEDGPSDGGGPGVDGGVVDTGAGGPNGPEFSVEVVEGLGSSALVGDFAQAAVGPEGRFVVAYGFAPAGGGEREIHYGVEGADGLWTSELVTRPGEAIAGGDDLKGLGLALVGGTPHVVFLGGDDDGRPTVEEPTDLVLATRGGAGSWTLRTLVDVSTEATGDCSEYCNEGFVVGSHAAISADDAGGFAVVYRDTHIGFARDDLALADVELYSEGGAFPRNSVVDAERGGGEHANVRHTPGGGLFVAYSMAGNGGEDTGVWAAVYDATDGWRLRRVWERRTTSRVGLAATADGALHVALYDSGDADLVVATSTDDGDTWSTERVDSAGKTGLFPSLAVDASGRLVVSYAYCGPASDRDCPTTLGPDAEVRLARKEASGWQTYSVDDGQGFGRVGLFTSIAVDAAGKLGVAFVDDQNGDLLFAREN